MKFLKIFLVIGLTLSALPQINAKDVYIAQSAAGNGNGVDAADAYPLSWLNTAANWGTGVGQVSPGDTVHLVGTFTSTLVVQASGLPGNPITILFEPDANFTAPCWSSTGAIQLNGVSWIVVDGGVNGLIQNTANGTGLAYTNNSRGIGGSGNGTAVLYNSVIQNLRITNMYTKVKGNFDPTRAGYDIDVSGSGITISNCVVSDGDGGLGYSATGTSQSNIYLLNNVILNCNHTIVIGMADHNCYLTNLVIAGNYLDHWDVWDCPGNSPIHLDGIILFNNAYDKSSIMDGTRIYGNKFGGYVGIRNTAAIFTDLGGTVRNYYIYNNLFMCYPSASWGNGFILAGGSNVWVVNNTCAGTNVNGTNFGGGLALGGDHVYCYNNCLLYGSMTLSSMTTNTVNPSQQGTNDLQIITKYFTNVWSDNNVIVNPVFQGQLVMGNANNGNTIWVSGILGPNLRDWQTWYENEWGTGQLGNNPLVPGLYQFAQLHCDPHSSTRMPIFVPGGYVPAANDPATVTKGTNLYWLGITNDFYGNPRPANGNWTIGAFEITPSGLPAPTISLVASGTQLTNGQPVTLTWNSSNATNVTVTGLGSVDLSGSIDIVATNSATYTATATGPGGVMTSIALLTVRPMPPSGLHVVQP